MKNQHTLIFILCTILLTGIISCTKDNVAVQTSELDTLILTQTEQININDADPSGGYDLSPEEAPEDDYVELFYSVYRVKESDMIGTIADTFNITQDTIISVNNIKNSRLLQIGQYLRIPTIPGIMYTAKSNDETIESIAQKYEVSSDKIAFVNEMNIGEAVTAGDSIFIPDGQLSWVERQEINGDLFTRPLRRSYYISSYYGYRTNPFTQKRSFHTGLDMVAPHGTPIYASLAGTVTVAGWSNVLGNYVVVRHHSGYTSTYAHMSKINVRRGAWVETYTKLGEIGNTGMSTGAHLHFSVAKYGRTVNPSGLW